MRAAPTKLIAMPAHPSGFRRSRRMILATSAVMAGEVAIKSAVVPASTVTCP